jgi:hypothetical protein
MLLLALAVVGAPAVALRAACVGKSCDDESAASVRVPFCPLPADLRDLIAAGFRDGRSPDVMGATVTEPPVIGGSDPASDGVEWPTDPTGRDDAVPILLFGDGVVPRALSPGVGLDQIAPTLSELIGYRRSHPEVRSGVPVPGAVRPGTDPPLVVVIAWSGVGSDAMTGTRWVRSLVQGLGTTVTGTFEGTTGSLPNDPAAVLTTIGTGGLPAEHGVTGSLIAGSDGEPVRAWSRGAPPPVIAAFGDDWDHHTNQRARIGLVARDLVDRGIVGGTWYLDRDRDDLVIGRDPVGSVRGLIASGYGADDTTDLVGVVLSGVPMRDDRATQRIVRLVRQQVADATFVLTATGRTGTSDGEGTSALTADVNDALGAPVVASAVPGGLFLDRRVMATSDVTSDDVVRAMRALRSPSGEPVFADAFPAFAVSFSRYC